MTTVSIGTIVRIHEHSMTPALASMVGLLLVSATPAQELRQAVTKIVTNQWYAPPERGGGQDVALATYQRGLDLARRQKGRVVDPLDPTWGEAELLMNLAFGSVNRATPDLAAAERYAGSALALVPYWHYVRDILR
jgi:hypothetical protein